MKPPHVNAALENLRKALKKPHVNSSCIGCGACVAIAGDVFELDGDGLSCVNALPEYPEGEVDDAISACPVSAISWQPANEDGTYMNGTQQHQDIV